MTREPLQLQSVLRKMQTEYEMLYYLRDIAESLRILIEEPVQIVWDGPEEESNHA